MTTYLAQDIVNKHLKKILSETAVLIGVILAVELLFGRQQRECHIGPRR